ncbi:hypothetical protein BaRGS_00020803, partial [Batillaria attramentaria]
FRKTETVSGNYQYLESPNRKNVSNSKQSQRGQKLECNKGPLLASTDDMDSFRSLCATLTEMHRSASFSECHNALPL